MMRAFACVVLVLAVVPAAASAAVRVETVSTRPDMVTGGDVLVRVSGAAPESIVVRVDGRDVTDSFRRPAGWADRARQRARRRAPPT